MPLLIKESFIYKMFESVLMKPYNLSILRKSVDKAVLAFKNSFIFKRADKYLDKKPYFLNSNYYKIIRKIVNIINKIMDFIHNLAKKIIKGSKVFLDFENIKKSKMEDKFLIASMCVCVLNVSYLLVGIVINDINIYMSLLFFGLTIILYIFGKNKNCLKECMVYKFFKSW